jgi:hypothetical protein
LGQNRLQSSLASTRCAWCVPTHVRACAAAWCQQVRHQGRQHRQGAHTSTPHHTTPHHTTPHHTTPHHTTPHPARPRTPTAPHAHRTFMNKSLIQSP